MRVVHTRLNLPINQKVKFLEAIAAELGRSKEKTTKPDKCECGREISYVFLEKYPNHEIGCCVCCLDIYCRPIEKSSRGYQTKIAS